MSDYVHKSLSGIIEIRDVHEGGGYVTIAIKQDGTSSTLLPPTQRQAAAQALAGDGYRVIAADVPHAHWLTADPDEPCPVCGQKIPQWERELLAREAQPDRDEYPRVQGICPSCGVGPLFRAEEGLITCSWVDCEEPDAAANLLADPPEQPDRPQPVDPSSVRIGDVVEIEADDGSWMVRARIADTDDPDHDGPRYPNDSPFGIKLDRFYLWPKLTDTTVRVLRRAEPEPDEAAVEAMLRALENADSDLGEREQEDWGALARELVRRGVKVEVPSDE